jgi:hypothetical protein
LISPTFIDLPTFNYYGKLKKGGVVLQPGRHMNDYTKGAFECLSWLEAKMGDLDRNSDKWESLRREVGDAINDIRRGVGVDFRERLRALI